MFCFQFKITRLRAMTYHRFRVETGWHRGVNKLKSRSLFQNHFENEHFVFHNQMIPPPPLEAFRVPRV